MQIEIKIAMFGFFLFLFGGPIAMDPALAYADKTAKELLLHQFPTSMPPTFCKKGQMFRKCIKLTDSECRGIANSAVKECTKKLESQIPDAFEAEEGKSWGEKFGACMGTEFMKAASVKPARVDSGCLEKAAKSP